MKTSLDGDASKCKEILDDVIMENQAGAGRVGKNRIAMRFGIHQHLNHHLCLYGLTSKVFWTGVNLEQQGFRLVLGELGSP